MMHFTPRYSVSFETKLLGVPADANVSVDVKSLEGSVAFSMRRLLSPNPAFVMTLDDLKVLAEGIAEMQGRVDLLNALPPGAALNQLECRAGGATATVFNRKGKAPQLNLTIGLYQWNGPLAKYSTDDLSGAVSVGEQLLATVKASIKSAGKGGPKTLDS